MSRSLHTGAMPSVPATCLDCGLVFRSGMGLSDGMATYNHISVSCPDPNCGGMGVIPDGTYEADARGVRWLWDLETEALRRLQEELENAKRLGPDEQRQAVEQIQTRFPLLKWFLSNSGAAAAAWIAVLLGLVQLVLNNRVVSDVHIEQQVIIQGDVNTNIDGEEAHDAEAYEYELKLQGEAVIQAAIMQAELGPPQLGPIRLGRVSSPAGTSRARAVVRRSSSTATAATEREKAVSADLTPGQPVAACEFRHVV